MDHFEFLAEGDVSPDDAFLSIHTRGLLWGRNVEVGPAQMVGGVFGGYDFESPEHIRVGAASLGLGGTFHLPLGDRDFFQGTGVVSFIPFGTTWMPVSRAGTVNTAWVIVNCPGMNVKS